MNAIGSSSTISRPTIHLDFHSPRDGLRDHLHGRKPYRGGLKQRVDRPYELGIFGYDLRPEAPHDLAVAADQELLKVPLDVAGLPGVIDSLAEDFVQRVLVGALDVELGKEGKRDPVVPVS